MKRRRKRRKPDGKKTLEKPANTGRLEIGYVAQVPKVRLFNLSPDTKVAGMSMGGTVLAVRKNDHLFFSGAVFPKMARAFVNLSCRRAAFSYGCARCVFASQSNVQYSLGSDWCAVPNSR